MSLSIYIARTYIHQVTRAVSRSNVKIVVFVYLVNRVHLERGPISLTPRDLSFPQRPPQKNPSVAAVGFVKRKKKSEISNLNLVYSITLRKSLSLDDYSVNVKVTYMIFLAKRIFSRVSRFFKALNEHDKS